MYPTVTLDEPNTCFLAHEILLSEIFHSSQSPCAITNKLITSLWTTQIGLLVVNLHACLSYCMQCACLLSVWVIVCLYGCCPMLVTEIMKLNCKNVLNNNFV